jgi:hypothetical protein
MDRVMRDLRDAKRIMADTLPGLVERGEHLESVSASVLHLLDETQTLRSDADRVRRQHERHTIALGLCCLCLCVACVYILLCASCRQALVGSPPLPD